LLRPNRCLEEIIKCFQPVKNYVLNTLVDTRDRQQEGYSTETSRDSLPSHSSAIIHTQAESEILASQNVHKENISSSSFTAADEKSLNSYISSFLASSSVPAVDTHQPPIASCSQPVRASIPSAHQKPPSQSSNAVKEVLCPVCHNWMRESIINIHLDSCLNSNKPAKRKPMPKLIYHLMKEQELKKRLRTLGLSTVGDKDTLINRHKKFTILYNSECDALEPRPVEELIEIHVREEAENHRLATELRLASAKVKTNDLEKIEEENLQYLRSNKESYDRLIDEIRQRPPLPPPPITLPLPEEPPAVKIKNEPPKVENESEEEVTELYVPPKVYEMICLSDSSESDEPPSIGSRPVSAAGTSDSDVSRQSTSDDSIPDPLESGSSKDSNSLSVGAQTITLSTSDSSSSNSTSPTTYSPVESPTEFLFEEESSSSLSAMLPTVLKMSKKRAKSPSLNMSDRKLSLRRRF
jgi:E3 ubiquitin-protein ligase RAD18